MLYKGIWNVFFYPGNHLALSFHDTEESVKVFAWFYSTDVYGTRHFYDQMRGTLISMPAGYEYALKDVQYLGGGNMRWSGTYCDLSMCAQSAQAEKEKDSNEVACKSEKPTADAKGADIPKGYDSKVYGELAASG